MIITEKRYAQIEKECLAIVYACEKFNQYILGKSTKIETDHNHYKLSLNSHWYVHLIARNACCYVCKSIR